MCYDFDNHEERTGSSAAFCRCRPHRPRKTAANLAGLGWIGKCALLVTRQFGSAVRLTTVLTDAEMQTGRPLEVSGCGTCTDCVDACPGHAPSGRVWSAGLGCESFFDAFACRKTAHERASAVGIDETICGICISVCPWTQKYLRWGGFDPTHPRHSLPPQPLLLPHE